MCKFDWWKSDQAKTRPAQLPATAMRVWCTPGGGGQHVLTLLEHSYCMLEGQPDFVWLRRNKLLPFSYPSSYSTLLGYRPDKHTWMRLSIRVEILTLRTLVHFILSLNIMSHVHPLCAVCYTSAWETVVMIPAWLTCPSSRTWEYYGYLWQTAVADLAPPFGG